MIFGKLFSKKAPALPETERDIEALTQSLSAPAIHIVTQPEPSLSHFGGMPSLPPGVAWPRREGKPLAFLARLSLSELHSTLPIAWLPTSGALLFFYDFEVQPWGFDPEDRGGWRVLYVPDLAEPGSVMLADDATQESPIQYACMGFRKIDSLPSSERGSVDELTLSDRELETYWELYEAPFRGEPKHQVGGYPAPVQGDDMELECQLVLGGLYRGRPDPSQANEIDRLKVGAEDWKLLFQFDTDDDLGVMWGDVGTIYFWVRQQEAVQGNFDNAWLVLQCC